MSAFPQIVVGTYEEFVLGYNPQYSNEKKTKCILNQTFATHSHQASLRCVAAYKCVMASSGADEYINIYNMDAMEVSTVINYHNSTVTCLEFTPDGSHLVTANQNGDIAIFRCKDWTLVKLWKEAHNHVGGVTSTSIHPSGSLLLTTGTDNIVRFWNLVKGRLSFAINFSKKSSLGNPLNFGMWSENGKFYCVCFGKTLEIYKTKTAAIFYKIQANSKITCSKFIKENLICLATEDGSLEVHLIRKKVLILKKQVHKTRVKSLSSFSLSVCKNDKYLTKTHIVSVDSKGGIKLWCLKKKKLNCLLLLMGETYCDCRITCLTMVFSEGVKTEKSSVSGAVCLNDSVTKSCEEEMNIIYNHKNTEQANKNGKNKLKKINQKINQASTNSLEHRNAKKLEKKVNKSSVSQNSKSKKEIIKHLRKKKQANYIKRVKNGFDCGSE